jgi:lysophospholipase L1-like esterase
LSTILKPRIRRVAVGLSLALNLVVLAGAAWLGAGGFTLLARAYIVEPTYQRWVSQWDAVPIQPGDTVFLGDSLTEFGGWDDLFPHTHVRNRGIAGDDTAGVLARLDQVTSGKPAQVFLMIGTNDLAAGDDEDEIVANVQAIVSTIRRDSPDTELFVQSLLPRAEKYREQVEHLNETLEPAVSDEGTWVDLYPRFLDDDGSIADSYSNDELHLLGEGYLVWRDAIDEHITRHIR